MDIGIRIHISSEDVDWSMYLMRVIAVSLFRLIRQLQEGGPMAMHILIVAAVIMVVVILIAGVVRVWRAKQGRSER